MRLSKSVAVHSVGTGLIGLVLVASFFGLMGCRKKDKPLSPPMVDIGPETKADMIILFDRGTSNQEIEDFIETDLSDPVDMGHKHKAGIGMVMSITTKAGQDGVAVYLEKDPEGSAFPQKFLAQKHHLKFTVVRDMTPVDL